MTKFEIRGPIPRGAGPLARLTAPEFSGTMTDPLKEEFVAVAQRMSASVEGIRSDLQTIGWDIGAVATAVVSLEDQIVPRFDTQIQYLRDQLWVLESIDASLKSPRRTEAAERIGQAAVLLSTKDFDWALKYADEAIEHDATSPAGYLAGGWALLGKNLPAEAIPYFSRATRASKEYKPWVESIRQLARCRLAVGDNSLARENLQTAIEYVGNVFENQITAEKRLQSDKSSKHQLPEATRLREVYQLDLASLYYDATIAAVLDGDESSAIKHISEAVGLDERFAQLALGEPLFEGHEAVPAHALQLIRIAKERRRDAIEKKIAQREAALLPRLERYEAIMDKARELGLFDPLLGNYRGREGNLRSAYCGAEKKLEEVRSKIRDFNFNLDYLTKQLDYAETAIECSLNSWIKGELTEFTTMPFSHLRRTLRREFEEQKSLARELRRELWKAQIPGVPK